jgi:carboxyl-terminal processing protease
MMRSRDLLYLSMALLAVLILASACSAGFIIGRYASGGFSQAASLPVLITPSSSRPGDQAGTPDELTGLFAPFWESWDIIQNQYVDQPVDSEVLMRGAIKGMFESLGDQHSSYMDPDQFQQANIPLEQKYEGIGAWVDTTAEYLTIFSPMPGSPAESVGLKPGDKVIAVDGEDMTGIDGSLVIRRILGPAGSTVRLTIAREGEAEPFEVEITRARITVPSVTTEMLEDGIAYVQIIQFAENTRAELRDKLQDVLNQEPVAMVVDLRNNGGGYLTTAVEVTSEFLGEGIILLEEYGDGTQKEFTALSGGLATEIPLVVLVNEGSASASEIMAGALQAHQRAPLVGMTTFGKGTVQNWIPLSRGTQGAVRITVARWLTPDGLQIHETGLQPDYVVELTEEDIHAERDTQLEKAIELLTGN